MISTKMVICTYEIAPDPRLLSTSTFCEVMFHPGTIHKGEVIFVKMIADLSTVVSLQLLVQDASEEKREYRIS